MKIFDYNLSIHIRFEMKMKSLGKIGSKVTQKIEQNLKRAL